VSASKNRPRWEDLPARLRRQIESLVGDRVVAAQNCDGGFSPGFASRLTLAAGSRAFVKAIDVVAWPSQAPMYRDEALVAAALTMARATAAAPAAAPATAPAAPPATAPAAPPATAPAAPLAAALATPRFLGSLDDGCFVILAFECVMGAEPSRPWQHGELMRVAVAVSRMSAALTPSPIVVAADHPRLGGWAALAEDEGALARLPAISGWAARHLDRLIALERDGLAAASGTALVHFDALPHNILLTSDQVVLVDWPHARLGASFIDLVMVLASAAADGIDPEPLLRARADGQAEVRAADVTGVLAALTGFWLAGALEPIPADLAPIAAAKLHLGRGALRWLRSRLGLTSTATTSAATTSTATTSTATTSTATSTAPTNTAWWPPSC
jgi:hypothetical protein